MLPAERCYPLTTIATERMISDLVSILITPGNELRLSYPASSTGIFIHRAHGKVIE
jgi:hypothetical protein